jgi:hypothetical protein
VLTTYQKVDENLVKTIIRPSTAIGGKNNSFALVPNVGYITQRHTPEGSLKSRLSEEREKGAPHIILEPRAT